MLDVALSLVKPEFPETQRYLVQAQAGDMNAYGELCRFYETPLLRQAMALSGDVSLAEDLAQDTLAEGWKYLNRYDGRCRFFTWLCAILLNRYRNTVRRKPPIPFSTIQAPHREPSEHVVDEVRDGAVLPDEAIEREEEAALVWRCIRALPVKHRQVIYLRFYVDDSLGGIAAALGCSVGTVKSRLFHALEKLRGMRALGHRHDNPAENI